MVRASAQKRLLTMEGKQLSDKPSMAIKQRRSGIENRLAPAILRDLVERLGKPLQGKGVGGFGALGGNALDRGIGGFAHGFNHPLLFGRVLDPESVALGVHRKRRAADLERRF